MKNEKINIIIKEFNQKYNNGEFRINESFCPCCFLNSFQTADELYVYYFKKIEEQFYNIEIKDSSLYKDDEYIYIDIKFNGIEKEI